MKRLIVFLAVLSLSGSVMAPRARADTRFVVVPAIALGPVRIGRPQGDAVRALAEAWGERNVYVKRAGTAWQHTVWIVAPENLVGYFDAYGSSDSALVLAAGSTDPRFSTASGLRPGLSKAQALRIMSRPTAMHPRLWWWAEFPPSPSATTCWSPSICVSFKDDRVHWLVVHHLAP